MLCQDQPQPLATCQVSSRSRDKCLVQAIWDSGKESCRSNLSLRESLKLPLPRSLPLPVPGPYVSQDCPATARGCSQLLSVVNSSGFPAQSHCLPVEPKCHPWQPLLLSAVLLPLLCVKCQVQSSSRWKQTLQHLAQRASGSAYLYPNPEGCCKQPFGNERKKTAERAETLSHLPLGVQPQPGVLRGWKLSKNPNSCPALLSHSTAFKKVKAPAFPR